MTGLEPAAGIAGAPCWVAGVDGCPGGWIVVLRPLHDPSQAVARLVPTFREVLAIEPAPSIVGVDIPIGIPETVGIGGRRADVEARSRLGGRQSAVFAVPSRAAVMLTDYREACAAAERTSVPPRRISKQCFNIFPKIREVDAIVTPAVQARVHETHPEVAFWALAGERPLDLPKKVKSRPHDPGLALRRGLLEAAGYDPRFLCDLSRWPRKHVGPDDLLDAAVCSWTAARIATGTARCFPATPERDAKGLRIEIWGVTGRPVRAASKPAAGSVRSGIPPASRAPCGFALRRKFA